jgi:DNA polymerase V
MQSIIALIDCNNFYCSCERMFDARLFNRPVVVLSNNDGCVIARSEEAKSAGIKMGVPFFQIEDVIARHDVAVFSSNYELYGDMSARVMETLGRFTPEVEVYSIDEAFLDLSGIPYSSLTELGRKIQETVYALVGIPVTVGIAETKTLAKIANRIAKKSEKAGGVLDLTRSPFQEHALTRTPVSQVWGIGRQYAKLLKERGVTNALQLRDVEVGWARRAMTVVGARVVEELRGVSCLPLELCPLAKRSITVSRSFGELVSDVSELCRAVAHYVTCAAVRLRKHGLTAGVVTAFLQTNRFSKEPQHFGSATAEIAVPTDSTLELLHYALRGLQEAFREGFQYKKAGVMFSGLVPKGAPSRSFFNPDRRERMSGLIQTVDRINRKFGRDTIHFGRLEADGRWKTKAEKRSPRYTTRWNELLTI